jgi:hypothetical protein
MILSEKKLRSIISQIIRENIEENSGFAPDSASASGANSALSLLLKKSFTLLKQICEEPRTNPGSLNQKELMYPVIEELIGFDYSGNKIHKMLKNHYEKGIFCESIANFVVKIIDEASKISKENDNGDDENLDDEALRNAFIEVEDKLGDKIEDFFIQNIFMKNYENYKDPNRSKKSDKNKIDFDQAKKITTVFAQTLTKQSGVINF